MRKFLIFYIGFALIPFGLLFFLFHMHGTGVYSIPMPKQQLGLLILEVGAASLVGFFAMHRMLSRIVQLSENVRRSILGKVDRAMVLELMKEEGEVADLAKSFNTIIAQLEGNLKELEETKKALYEVLTKVGRALTSMENFESLLRLTLETSVDALGAVNGAIFAFEPDGKTVLKAWIANPGIAEDDIHRATRSYLEWVTKENRVFVLQAVGNEERAYTPFSPPVVCVPLAYQGNTWGAICVSGKRYGHNFTDDEITLVHTLGYQIAVAFENVQLSRDKERIYFETMSALALAVEARDPYSRGHSESVGEVAVAIGESMGLPEKDIQTLRDASRLHDLGKIGITDSILQKPAALGHDEMEIMKRHPVIGENIVAPLKTFNHLIDPIRHHHERLDGSGYPDGLKADQIPMITRIMSVADIYDALKGDRPYRKGMSVEEVKQELDVLVAGGKLDASVVDHLYRTISRKTPSG